MFDSLLMIFAKNAARIALWLQPVDMPVKSFVCLKICKSETRLLILACLIVYVAFDGQHQVSVCLLSFHYVKSFCVNQTSVFINCLSCLSLVAVHGCCCLDPLFASLQNIL